MKEATGELNITVLTVIAIAAVAALFYAFVWPMIQRTIVDRTCKTYGDEYKASLKKEGTCIDADDISGDTNDKNKTWYCCKPGAGA